MESSLVRRPIFNADDQTWRWWSTPSSTVTMEDDRANAILIDVQWSVGNDGQGGRHWHGLFAALPGFARFLWNIAHGYVWLRRPEGVWKAPLPKLRRRDYLLMQEGHPTLGYRLPIMALPEFQDDSWHFNGSDEPVSLDDVDQSVLGRGCFSSVLQPVLMIPPDRHRYTYGPRVLVPDWSEPGPMDCVLDTVRGENGAEKVLLVTLPNGIVGSVGLDRSSIFHDLILRGDVRLEIGDNHWNPCWSQPINV